MKDTERIIGSLEEFKRSVEKRLDEIEREVRALNNFKIKIIGGASALSFVISGAFELIKTGHLPWKGH